MKTDQSRITFVGMSAVIFLLQESINSKQQIYDSSLRIMLIVQSQISLRSSHGVMYDCRNGGIMFRLAGDYGVTARIRKERKKNFDIRATELDP